MRILPSKRSELGRLATVLDKRPRGAKATRLVWIPVLNADAWYQENTETVSLATDDLIRGKIGCSGRHELEHANSAALKS